MRLTLPYGEDSQSADLDWGRPLATLDIADVPALPDVEEAVCSALDNPIGMDGSVYSAFRPGETVAILVSDSFRRTAADRFLPVLLEGLGAAGIRELDILFLFATGTHRPPTPDEQRRILGLEVYQRFSGRIFAHDPHDTGNLRHVGTTGGGTPVWVNRRALDCNRLIATGAVVLHYFGGYGGGRKSILPGIAGIETISRNHSRNLDPHSDRLDPRVAIGKLEGNPVAEDMLEGARFVKVDFMLNTVLDREGRIAGLFAGDLEAAHLEAAAFARRLFAVTIDQRADLVIASSGGTRNFVQTHKALFNAYQAVRPEGRIVLLAQCPEGLGGDQFVKWLRLGNRSRIIEGLREHSEINGQTALSTVEKAPRAFLVTDMSEAEVELLQGRKADDLSGALEAARQALRASGIENPTYYLMPSAAYTVPFLNS